MWGPLNYHALHWQDWRRSRAQRMRSENCRVSGSRWNRPCILALVCDRHSLCPCDLPRIVTLRSRTCNRVACSFLKFCRAIPSTAEQAPPWRHRWWDASQEYWAYLMQGRVPDNFT